MKVWEDTTVDKITTESIRKLVLENLNIKSDGNREYIMKAIRGAFAHAVDKGIIVRNPCPNVRFKKKQKLETVLNKQQVAFLLQKAKETNWEWYTQVKTALYTGMRNGELYALSWQKVDLKNGWIKVDCSWNGITGFKETKSGDDRLVPIAPELKELLLDLRKTNPNGEFVLPRSTRWDNGEQARELRMFLSAIGLPPIRFHDLRATWATLLLASGVEAIKVMKIGGWKDYETMDRYLRLAGVDVQFALSNFSLEKT